MYQRLPTRTLWWSKYEPVLVSGIEARLALNLIEGAPIGPPVVVTPKGREKWVPLVTELIEAADAAWRKSK